VEPETYYVPNIEQTFTINISVANVADLWGWEFELFYSSTHLNGTDVKEGTFLKTAGETFFWIVNSTDKYNATHGYIHTFCILTSVIPGADGAGTIANITFKSKACGNSTLNLTGTKLKNSAGAYIQHENYNGTVIVKTPGDANGDGMVDGVDQALLGMAWLSTPGDPNYDERCDFNEDGAIDGVDQAILGMYWGYGT